ncbi:PH domain-containing protein [Paenibacillus soyae]|uniref:PH domain-containing protein n=1 Tax=Paenibacillus soyae TaxID=2969249 RepID=A0A9X2MME3_9BACL|nr:PH domain-containing protein [Paenibacillus soyae]MCR2803336.1 PH domain-containing protein [Paenibacillus soyae]
MLNERRTLHPSYILFVVFSIIKGFLPIIIVFLLKRPDWADIKWYWYAGVGGLLLIFVLLSYLSWRRFGFWLEEDRIIIRSGILFREEKTIYYSRIHSVNIEQPLIQRLLGVVQLKIETPGGNKKADGILHTLKTEEANEIKQLLRRQTPVAGQESGTEAGGAATEMSGAGASLAGPESAGVDAVGAAASFDTRQVSSVNVSSTAAGNDKLSGQNGAAGTQGIDIPDAQITLGPGQLFQAAASSLNFGLAAAFIGGLYSFADDFLDLLLPEHFFEDVVEDSIRSMPSVFLIVGIAVVVILFAWILSILLYILKYSGFTLRRDGKQVMLSYGLLEKKSILFDPKNVQAVIVGESWLRQPFGYAEVKLQVVSSDKNEQLMLHPFIKATEIQKLLHSFVPGIMTHASEQLALSPRKALIYYVRIPLLIALCLCIACIWIFGAVGAWSLAIVPLTLWWRISCHRAAGLLLHDGQLTIRKRILHRITYYVRRPRIVVMKVKRSDAQRRRGIAALSVNVLGSPFGYTVSGMEQSVIQPIWNWFSRSGKNGRKGNGIGIGEGDGDGESISV